MSAPCEGGNRPCARLDRAARMSETDRRMANHMAPRPSHIDAAVAAQLELLSGGISGASTYRYRGFAESCVLKVIDAASPAHVRARGYRTIPSGYGGDTALTLCHGDCHLDNLLRDPDGRLIWADWQEARKGYGPSDLAFCLQRAEATGAAIAHDRCGFPRALHQNARQGACDGLGCHARADLLCFY